MVKKNNQTAINHLLFLNMLMKKGRYKTAERTLNEKKDILEKVVAALLEKETLEKAEYDELVFGTTKQAE